MKEGNKKNMRYFNFFIINNVNIVMHKISKKKKGSTLMMVMAVMAILMISGTAILSLSLSEYKYRGIEQSKKMSLYASEAGINEAYNKMQEYVNNAIEQGNKAVEAYNGDLSGLLDSEIGKISNNSATTSEYIKNIVWSNEDKKTIISYSINEEKINEDRKAVFIKGYHLNSLDVLGYDDYILNNTDNAETTSLVSMIKKADYGVKSGDSISITPQISSNSGLMPLKVELDSKYTTNSIQRELKVTYYINEAEYNKKYDIPSQMIRLPKAGFSKALMVGKNMKLQSGAKLIAAGSSINGDVTKKYNSDIYVAGDNSTGITLEGNNELNVNGNIATYNNIELKGENNNLSVISGNLYAKNFFIDENSSNSSVELKNNGGSTRDGSLYTLDDFEINGSKSKINIGGDYNGVSDGSSGSVDSNGYHNDPDNSSCLVVNTEDIGVTEGSSLTINKNVNIAGTSYITLAGDKKYQTGESVSVKGNYVAYTSTLTKDTTLEKYREKNIIFEYWDPLRVVTKFNTANTDSGDIVAILDNSNYVNVGFTDIGKLKYTDITHYEIYSDDKQISAISAMGSTSSITDKKNTGDKVNIKLYKSLNDTIPILVENIELKQNSILTAFDKSQYFKFYGDEYADNSGLNLKGITVIGDKNINIGAIINNKSIVNSNLLDDYYNNYNKLQAKSVQLKNQIFYMGMGKEKENIDRNVDIDTIEDINDPNVLNIYNSNEAVIKIDDIYNFMENENEINDEILYIKSDSTKNYILKGESSGSVVGENIIDISNPKRGIIIVPGNLDVYGQVNFKGMIICNGILTIEPGSSLNLTYDEEYLHNFVIKNCSALSNVFKFPYETNDQGQYVTTTIFSNTATDEGKSSSVITMDKWQLIK